MCFAAREGAAQHSETIKTFSLLSRGVRLSQAAQVSAMQPGHFHTSLVMHPNQMCAATRLLPRSGGTREQGRLEIHCLKSPSVLTGCGEGL